ncbi:MAG: response regulator [Myxococcales bacterium]|nr:MAG: response regulator [Myxococcales bacterium]
MSDIRAQGSEDGRVPPERRFRILIVDDEEINLKILRIYLEDKGYEVISALNGEEAINLLKSEDITACICDIRMPKISGIDVLNFVQQHRPIVPVIMLTGFIDINTAVSVMRQGASNYLTKPIDAGELIISVEKAIAHRKLVEEKLRLERENLEYQRDLEKKIEEKALALQQNMLDMVVSLANAVEERDRYLIGHSKRVAQYGNMLARALGLEKDQLRTLHTAAILHDIGKIGIPDAILRKAEPLTAEEAETMQTHVARGVNIIEPVGFLRHVLPVLRHHHENWDGSGYPAGQASDQIPLLSRIIRLVDYFDVLTTARANRQAIEVGRAMEDILRNKGVLFDPQLVDPFLELVKRMVDKLPRTEERIA